MRGMEGVNLSVAIYSLVSLNPQATLYWLRYTCYCQILIIGFISPLQSS